MHDDVMVMQKKEAISNKGIFPDRYMRGRIPSPNLGQEWVCEDALLRLDLRAYLAYTRKNKTGKLRLGS